MSYLENSYAITNSLRITINDHKLVILKTKLSGCHLNDMQNCQVHLLHFINRARCGRDSCTFPFQSSCQMLANRSTIVNATIEMLSVFFFKARPERIRWQQVGEIVRTTRGNSPSNSDRKRCQLIFCTISIDLSASWFFLAWSNGSRLKEWPRCWSRRFVGSAKWNELTIWCNCDFFVWLFVFWVFFFCFAGFYFVGRTRPQRSEFKRNAYRASKKSSNTNGNGNSSEHKTWNWKCQTLKDN